MAIIAVSLIEADAQTRTKSKRKTNANPSSVTLTTTEIINSLRMEVRKMSAQCPIVLENGLIQLESVSFKDKCMYMTFAYTDKVEEYFGDISDTDYSYMDYAAKLTIATVINSAPVSASSFAKADVSFGFTFKDSSGTVLWSKSIASDEYMAFYNDLILNGDLPKRGNSINLEYFRQLVKSWNASTPEDLGDGSIITSITMEGSIIYYNISTSYSYALMTLGLSKDEKELIRVDIAKYLYDIFTLLDTQGSDTLINEMIGLNIEICYRFFVSNDDRPYYMTSLPSSYIKSVGKAK